MKQWICLFSQTGTEIVDLSAKLGIIPDLVFTNNANREQYNPGLKNVEYLPHDQLMELFRSADVRSHSEDTLVTLHGYLRIIPADICDMYEIYNGHPAAIKLYPELKGFNPQIRAWENREKYPIIGSVVHKVTPGVDEGEIVASIEYINRVDSLDEMYAVLRKASLQSWAFFLKRTLVWQ